MTFWQLLLLLILAGPILGFGWTIGCSLGKHLIDTLSWNTFIRSYNK